MVDKKKDIAIVVGIGISLLTSCYAGIQVASVRHDMAKPAILAQRNKILPDGEYSVLAISTSSVFGSGKTDEGGNEFLIAPRTGGLTMAAEKPAGVKPPSDWQSPDDYLLKITKGEWSFVESENHKKRQEQLRKMMDESKKNATADAKKPPADGNSNTQAAQKGSQEQQEVVIELSPEQLEELMKNQKKS